MIRPGRQHRTVQAADPDRDHGRGRGHRWRRRRDWGGILARLICVLFALIGVIPLGLGGLARLDDVQRWAADQTSQVLHDQLGLDARYELELVPWPLQISMSDVVIEASDGGAPFLEAQRVVARPRVFSLLAGKPDLGDLEVEDAVIRAVIRDGELANLDYRLPESEPSSEAPTELPLSAIAVTNARVDVTIDDLRLRSNAIDVDLTVGRPHADQKPLMPAGVIEVSVRAGHTLVDRRHPAPGDGDFEMLDEDVICGLDLRARVAEDILVRRLDLRGGVDLDPAPGTRPGCDLPEDDWRRLIVSLQGGELRFRPSGGLDTIDGRLEARLPIGLAHRFVDLAPVTGWAAVDLDRVHYDPSHQLPDLEGRLEAAELSIDTKMIAREVEGALRIESDQLQVQDMRVAWAGGVAHFPRVELSPFEEGFPLMAHDVVIEGVTMPDLLNDLAAHPHAHVGWVLERAALSHFGGTIMPLDLSGPIDVDSRDFAIWDSPTTATHKKRLMGVEAGRVSGTFQITPRAVVLNNMTLVTARSTVKTTVSLGFDETLGLAVHEGTMVDLRDVSPLVDIEMEGRAEITGEGSGNFGDPHLEAQLAVDDFVFGGFPIGKVVRSKVAFVPLELSITEGRVQKGNSDMDIPLLRVAFDDGDADVVLQGTVDSRRGGMRLHDFFRIVNLLPAEGQARGALPLTDPTWEQIDGEARGQADFAYVLGGRRDRCNSGRLSLHAHMDLSDVALYGIAFDGGEVDFDWRWDDIAAGDQGLEVELHSGVLRKGTGTIVTQATIREGAAIHADVVGTAVPIDELRQFREAFGLSEEERDDDALRRIRPEANLSFVAGIGGTLGRLEGRVDAEISPMRIGPDLLPASRFAVEIVPTAAPPTPIGRTACGHPIYPGFDPQRWAADESGGIFSLSGELFGEQVRFEDLQITQQRDSMVSGRLSLNRLDLGALANLIPDVAFSASPPGGHLTAEVHIDELPVEEPGLAEVRLFVKEAVVERRQARIRIADVREPILLSGDALRVPSLPLDLRLGSGLEAKLVGGGTVEHLSREPVLSLGAQLSPIDLGKLGVEIPSVERASGMVKAGLAVDGPLSAPQLSGRLELEDGMLRLASLPVSFDDIDVDLRIEEGEIAIRRATARVGNTGRVSVSGRIPLRGMDIATADATLIASDVKIPVAQGVKMTADARLNATYVPSSDGAQRALPNITGRVTLKQFSYTRPITFRLDLDALTGGGRTKVESYNPEDDNFSFDVAVVSPRPVTIANNLLDMRLDLGAAGLRLAGTDQRFGGQGQLRIVPGSKLFLQGHDFVVRDGSVTFDNPDRISPKLDVTATTEYRRYAASGAAATAASTSTDTGAGNASGGRWRITMHAYGDAEAPEVRFTSDPPLSQEDIVLLLQVGMTRAELDRNLSGALAQTVGLEALNAVTGLDQAFQSTVPIIDEFRVGTQYSSRTGRPEPSVTLGKRITDDVRASVTTGLSENREVRSNVEWRLKGGVSVQGSYDNVNEVSNAGIGNIGAGLRWRLEFE